MAQAKLKIWNLAILSFVLMLAISACGAADSALTSNKQNSQNRAELNNGASADNWTCEFITTSVGDKLFECSAKWEETSQARYPLATKLVVGCGNGMDLYAAISITAKGYTHAWYDSPAWVQFGNKPKEKVILNTNGVASHDWSWIDFGKTSNESARILSDKLRSVTELGFEATDAVGRVWAGRFPVEGFEKAALEISENGCKI